MPGIFNHDQYETQAMWTRQLRTYIYRKIGLINKKNVLEPGCGTGVITRELCDRCDGRIIGLDTSITSLKQAGESCPSSTALVQGNILEAPFKKGSFHGIIAHYVLMWMQDISGFINTCASLLVPGGHLVALAEPDFGGTIEYPEMLKTRELYISALKRAGADPFMGRKLKYCFSRAGLEVEGGVSQGILSDEYLFQQSESKWDFFAKYADIQTEELIRLRKKEKKLLHDKALSIYIPLFWCVGIKI